MTDKTIDEPLEAGQWRWVKAFKGGAWETAIVKGELLVSTSGYHRAKNWWYEMGPVIQPPDNQDG